MKNKPYQMLKNTDNSSAEILIYGDIVDYEWFESDVSSYSFAKDLKELGDISELIIRINSNGGNVSEGLAIYNLLSEMQCKKIAKIDGFACSIASVIPMACDVIEMPRTSAMMIHNCWTFASGNAEELRKCADTLDKLMKPSVEAYMKKFKQSEDELKAFLDAETWLTADEALGLGLCTVIPESDEFQQSSNVSSILKLVQENKSLAQTIKELEQKKHNPTANEFLEDFLR